MDKTLNLTKQRQKWLVLFNCQGFGLGNCLTLLNPRLDVTSFNVLTSKTELKEIETALDTYDRIIVAPRVENELGFSLDDRENVLRVPHILFRAFHPDLLYVRCAGKLKHASAIAYAAFSLGLSVEETLVFYREASYKKLGYLDLWDNERKALLSTFSCYGFDLKAAFLRWSRTGTFMYLPNHPHIYCLFDLAKLILHRLDISANESHLLPHDNLVNGPVFPVYPEIASRLGMQGNYLIKTGGRYSLLDLSDFVAQCFKQYHESAGKHAVLPAYAEQLQRTMDLLRRT